MQTFSGRALDLVNPDPADVDPADIAHSLSRLCRYAGATREHYSVAEHCCHVHDWLQRRHRPLAFPGLLHDAHEYVLTDIPSPIMAALSGAGRADFSALKRRLDVAIGRRFSVEPDLFRHEAVREADRRILLDELAAQLAPPPKSWQVEGPPLHITIHGWSAERAKAQWLMRLHGHRPLDVSR